LRRYTQVEEPFCIEFWGQQVIDFAAEVAGASETDKAVVVGRFKSTSR
jgi:hypothetical protein